MADDPDGGDVNEDTIVSTDQDEMRTNMIIKDLVPGERVLVTVEAALPDIVVVSLEHGNKSFQGALLDATKRGLPCGVQPPEPIKGPDGDKLSNIAARFSYFQEKRHSTLPKLDLKRSAYPPPKSKNARPTVRLRPRQVLCSKCRSICNENNENVGRKRKAEEQSHTDLPPRRSDRRCVVQQQQQQQQQQHTQSLQKTRSQRLLNMADQSDESSSSKPTATSTSDQSNKYSASLIPKLSRLRPADITGASATPQSAGSVKSCIKLAEKMRNAYWNGRDEENLSQSMSQEEETENRPINGLAQPEPMELDSNPTQAYCATPRRLSSSSVESAKVPPEEEDKKTLAAADSTVRSGGSGRALRAQRKKRSIGLMEDLWDESVFEDPASRRSPSPPTTNPTIMLPTRTTPVIKISFGAQGEGTVLKIPSKIQHPYVDREVDTDNEETMNEPDRDPLELPNGNDSDSRYEDDCQEQVDPQKQNSLVNDSDAASTKAEKKALKKATKKVWKILQGAVSQAPPVNGSPRYYVNFDKLMHNRRKHKVKRKKRHKEERKHKSSSSNSSENKIRSQVPSNTQEQPDCLGMEVDPMMNNEINKIELPIREEQRDQEQQDASAYNTAIKEQCLKQKLSISLKRLNTNAYAPRYDHHHSYPVSNTSSGCKSSGATSDEEEEEEEEYEESSCMGSSEHEVNGAETAPDFPSVEHPLVMRLTAATTQDVVHYTSNGRKMDVGDVVWGKVHGFPWWPGKVLSITDSPVDEGAASGPQAHVAWYGSSTSSLMSCDQLSPFLETFKSRYNKKKKGPYKEAIRQATNEAEARNQIAPNSTNNVLDVCGSPREVNVLS